MKTKQTAPSFADLAIQRRKKVTRSERLLGRIESLVDFSFTKEMDEKLYKGGDRGRRPYGALLLFKVLILQNLNGMSDAETEEAIYDRYSFQKFLGLNAEDDVPDETTIGLFRKKLVEEKYDKYFFKEVERQVKEQGFWLKKGKSVDATISEVPKGRKRDDGTNTRDEDASFTKKGGRTYHGYKGHSGTDTKGKFIQKIHTSTAKDHDSIHFDKVTDGNEISIFADSAYINKERKKQFRKEGKFYGVMERSVRDHKLSHTQKKRKKKLSSVRCRVEHPFAEIKCRMKFKSRYRGLRKNEWQFTMVAAVYNIKRLVGQFFPAQKAALEWRC